MTRGPKPRTKASDRSTSAQHIIEQRRELGWTQKQLAHMLDISTRTVQQYELDERKVPHAVLLAVNWLVHCRRNAEIE